MTAFNVKEDEFRNMVQGRWQDAIGRIYFLNRDSTIKTEPGPNSGKIGENRNDQ